MNSTDGHEVLGAQMVFSWLDMLSFVLMLALSTLIGVYFGLWGKKEDTPKEYLHGGKTMSILPVAMSLSVSVVSGVTVMGAPSEIYLYGTLYWLICISCVIVGLINNYFYLPVFYDLQLTSTYEYLELRFSKKVRVMASVLYTINLILFIPIAVYVPALALNLVSGMNIYFISIIITVLCVFYTMVGGIKAVVWTDFLQGIVMLVSSFMVVILGLQYVGGFETMWERNTEAGRIRFFEMSLSPFKRMTFWSAVIGDSFGWMGTFVVNQAMVQKFMALPTYSNAQWAQLIAVSGLIVLKSTSCFTGLLIYAYYYDCDPIKAGFVTRQDQILPYYVVDIASSIPGFSGIFISGIFSASLSSMSSGLNSLGATLFEDFIRPCLKQKISEKTVNNIIKCVVVIIGAISVMNVFVVDKLGGVLQMTIAVGGVTSGATLGLFTFGMLFPRGNTQGALVGSIASMLFMSWIVFGNMRAIADGSLVQSTLPTSVDGCGINLNVTEPQVDPHEEDDVFFLYKLSFMYFTTIGTFVTLLVATVVSLMTSPPEKKQQSPNFFFPFVRRRLEARRRDSHTMEPVDRGLLNTTERD